MCGGGPHPVEKVSDQPHCERDLRFESGLPLDSSAFIALYLFLSQLPRRVPLTLTLTHTLMGVIFFIAPLLVSLSLVFLSEASSLISAAHCVSFILPRLLTELFIPAPC